MQNFSKDLIKHLPVVVMHFDEKMLYMIHMKWHQNCILQRKIQSIYFEVNSNSIIPKALSPQTTHFNEAFIRLIDGLVSFDISKVNEESEGTSISINIFARSQSSSVDMLNH